jgi:serine/threonine protein kinase
MLNTLSPAQWEKARQAIDGSLIPYFETSDFIFIKPSHQIIAYPTGNKGIIGQGRFSIIKIGQNEQGTPFAVKIETIEEPVSVYEAQAKKENEVLTALGLEPYVTIKRRVQQPGAAHLKPTYLTYYYGAMPFLKGNNILYAFTSTPPTESQAIAIALQCCEKIKEMHQRGVTHQDIHAENFMLEENYDNPSVTVIDFGKAEINTDPKKLKRDVEQLWKMFVNVFSLDFLKKSLPISTDPLTLDRLMMVLSEKLQALIPPTEPVLPTIGDVSTRIRTLEEKLKTKRAIEDNARKGNITSRPPKNRRKPK